MVSEVTRAICETVMRRYGIDADTALSDPFFAPVATDFRAAAQAAIDVMIERESLASWADRRAQAARSAFRVVTAPLPARDHG